MKNQVSNEQYESAMKGLFAEAALSDEMVNEIADSPAVWWAVQRDIAGRNPEPQTAWPPPIAKLWRILKFGVPAFAAVAVLIGVFMFRPADPMPEKVAIAPASAPTATQVLAEPVEPTPIVTRDAEVPARSNDTRHFAYNRSSARRAAAPAKRAVLRNQPALAKTEIRSEFIALSYARDAESGQVVRVKVPSSMMVTLGLVTTVEKPALLVDAEVIIGDDGLTRAIRFIR